MALSQASEASRSTDSDSGASTGGAGSSLSEYATAYTCVAVSVASWARSNAASVCGVALAW